MIRFTLLILIMFSLIAGSCSGRKNKLDHSKLIPEKELIPILTDIYITDGLLTIQKVQYMFSSPDSLSTYHHIIKKHGYSKETMDKTMKYYFIKNPKKLIKIYDQVLGILSEMESLVEKEALLAKGHIENHWTGKEFYIFPDLSGTDSARFDITLNKTGVYTLAFSATLFPDDQSVSPRITVFSCHPDSIETGKRDYIKTIYYIKDGRPHTYTLIINDPGNTTLHLRGWFYDFDNRPDEREKHLIIEAISFTYTSVAL
ncbi:MAG: DUF4296 domain-containing protein [Bacteroidia bacterium]|nr:DUF4296 domain-containing protein [Bacteroidia bacterium]